MASLLVSRSVVMSARHAAAPSKAAGGKSTAVAVAVPKRGMATLKDLQIRKKSVTSIKKITASMKMVAAAKLRQVQARNEVSRPFYAALEQTMSEKVDKLADEQQTAAAAARQLVVAVTSDRGLCGALNSSIVRAIKKLKHDKPSGNLDLIVLGDKGKAGLLREMGSLFVASANDLAKKPITFLDLMPLVERVSAAKFDSAVVIYNKFISVVTSAVTKKSLLSRDALQEKINFDDYELEGEKADVIDALYEFHVSTVLYNAVMENSTAEMGARMSSMDNATKNAGEMLKSLSLQFNKQRQAKITTELTEIISGAQGVSDS